MTGSIAIFSGPTLSKRTIQLALRRCARLWPKYPVAWRTTFVPSGMNAKCPTSSGTPVLWSKHYHPELGTSKVDKLLQELGARHAVSRLAVTETFSVFAGKVRSGLITLIEFDELCRRFLADTKGKLFSVARLLVAHHREAERLLRLYGPQAGQGLRTLDSLQLAVALDLRN